MSKLIENIENIKCYISLERKFSEELPYPKTENDKIFP